MLTIALEEWGKRHLPSRVIARVRENVKFSCKKNAKNRALILTYIDM